MKELFEIQSVDNYFILLFIFFLFAAISVLAWIKRGDKSKTERKGFVKEIIIIPIVCLVCSFVLTKFIADSQVEQIENLLKEEGNSETSLVQQYVRTEEGLLEIKTENEMLLLALDEFTVVYEETAKPSFVKINLSFAEKNHLQKEGFLAGEMKDFFVFKPVKEYQLILPIATKEKAEQIIK